MTALISRAGWPDHRGYTLGQFREWQSNAERNTWSTLVVYGRVKYEDIRKGWDDVDAVYDCID